MGKSRRPRRAGCEQQRNRDLNRRVPEIHHRQLKTVKGCITSKEPDFSSGSRRVRLEDDSGHERRERQQAKPSKPNPAIKAYSEGSGTVRVPLTCMDEESMTPSLPLISLRKGSP